MNPPLIAWNHTATMAKSQLSPQIVNQMRKRLIFLTSYFKLKSAWKAKLGSSVTQMFISVVFISIAIQPFSFSISFHWIAADYLKL